MLKILCNQKIDAENHSKITFIRIEPSNLKEEIKKIIISISDTSWIKNFNEPYLQASFYARAEPTILDIKRKILANEEDKISSETGEYIVSELSRQAIASCLSYTCIPLAELFQTKVSGNPGFDFHGANDNEVLFFGEAKYLSSQNAYGTGLKQVVNFIKDKKDIKDLIAVRDFFNENVLNNAHNGIKGYAVGFSSKKTTTENLIKKIKENINYKNLLQYHELILVAVNI